MKNQINQILAILALIGLSACQPSKTVRVYEPSPTATTTQTQAQGEPKIGTLQGTINGGGGKGVLCQRDGKTTLEVLDLYEGRVLYQRKPKDLKVTNEREMIEAVSELLSEHIISDEENKDARAYFDDEIIAPLVKSIRYIDGQVRVKETNDSKEPLIEQGCQVVQIAVYHDESILLINQKFWQKLDWRNRTALILHEVIYRFGRGNLDESDSTNSRKLVAFLMSKEGAISYGGRYVNNGYAVNEMFCDLKDKNGLVQGSINFNSKPVKNGQIGTEVVFKSLKPLKTGFLATYGDIDHSNVFQDLARDQVFTGSLKVIADGFDHIGLGYAQISLAAGNRPSACGENEKWPNLLCHNQPEGDAYVGELQLDGRRTETYALTCEEFSREYSCQWNGQLGKEFENITLGLGPRLATLSLNRGPDTRWIMKEARRVVNPQNNTGLYLGSGVFEVDGLVGNDLEIEVPPNAETGSLRNFKTTIRYQTEKGTVEAKDIQCKAN